MFIKVYKLIATSWVFIRAPTLHIEGLVLRFNQRVVLIETFFGPLSASAPLLIIATPATDHRSSQDFACAFILKQALKVSDMGRISVLLSLVFATNEKIPIKLVENRQNLSVLKRLVWL